LANLAATVAGVVAVLLIGSLSFYFITERIPIFKVRFKGESSVYMVDPLYYEKLWKENLFIPYEGYFPEELGKTWPDCSFKVKTEVDALENAQKISLCKHEVALALEMWKYVESEGEVNLDYLKDYGLTEEQIIEMENAIAEARNKLNGSSSNPALKARAADIIREASIEIGSEWVLGMRG